MHHRMSLPGFTMEQVANQIPIPGQISHENTSLNLTTQLHHHQTTLPQQMLHHPIPAPTPLPQHQPFPYHHRDTQTAVMCSQPLGNGINNISHQQQQHAIVNQVMPPPQNANFMVLILMDTIIIIIINNALICMHFILKSFSEILMSMPTM